MVTKPGPRRTPPLPRSFYARPTLNVAHDLVGCLLVHEAADGEKLVARVVETEAYRGDDPACHAYRLHSQGRTPEGKAGFLYGKPGFAYVYLNYGMYWLLNVVTEAEGTPGAVLIRAVEPVAGLADMRARRPKAKKDVDMVNGPGKLTLALGIDGDDHGRDMTRPPLFFSPDPAWIGEVGATPRIGISQAKELPWRFIAVGSPYVSPSPFNASITPVTPHSFSAWPGP